MRTTRRTFSCALALAASLLAPVARAADAPKPSRHDESQAHFLGLRYDLGARGSSLGAGYLHAHEDWVGRGGLGFGAWFGYGGDVRVLTQSYGAVDGVFGFGVVRGSMMGDAGGAGVELAIGAGRSSLGAQVVASPGFYWSVYYVDIGWSYTAPLAPMLRADAMASHQLSVRIHVPLARHARRTWFGD